MGSCIRLRLSSSQALPLNQQVNASLWGRERERVGGEGVGVGHVGISAHLQSAHWKLAYHHVSILPPCAFSMPLKLAGHDEDEGWGWWQREWKILLCPEELCFSHGSPSYSFPLSSPSDIFSFAVSLQRPPPSRFKSFNYLSCHSHSLTTHFPSLCLSLPLPLSCPLLYPFPFCLPPLV